jgi:hypothetical protein
MNFICSFHSWGTKPFVFCSFHSGITNILVFLCSFQSFVLLHDHYLSDLFHFDLVKLRTGSLCFRYALQILLVRFYCFYTTGKRDTDGHVYTAELVWLLEVSTSWHRGLSCTWTTEACAAPGLIYTTEDCAAEGGKTTTDTLCCGFFWIYHLMHVYCVFFCFSKI